MAFLEEICLKCTNYLCFIPWRIKYDNICCFLSAHTTLPVLEAILDFPSKQLFHGYFDINFTLYAYFNVNEVEWNHIKLFVSNFETVVSNFALLPVLVAILNVDDVVQ